MAVNKKELLRLQRKELELLKEIKKEKAKESFFDFLTFMFPYYVTWNWHHKYICDTLQEFYEGAWNRLMIFTAPQHQKSTCMTEYFPAYVLGRNPNASVLLTMYNETKAGEYNRKVQRVIDTDDYRLVFPETTLNTKNIVTDAKGSFVRNSSMFEIVNKRGFFKSVGVGSGIAGTPAKIALMDDVIKSVEEAYSATFRNKIYDWYTDELEARLHNDSKVAFTITRRHEDDLAGRLLDRDGKIEDGGKWKVIILPALKEDNSNPDDPREIGEALFPELHSRERLEEIRDNNPRTFASLYQQRPAPSEGNMVKRKWFVQYELNQIIARIKKGLCVPHFYIDTASSEKEQKNNDPTGILIWTVYNGKIYLLHYFEELMGFPDLIDKIKELKDFWGTDKTRIYIENKNNGASVKQELIRSTQMNVTLDNIKGDKVARLDVESEKIQTGRVCIPLGERWVEGWLISVTTFPGAKHDEPVDTLTGAMRMGFGNQKRKPQETIYS